MDAAAHWERIHAENAPEDVSWTQGKPTTSLALLRAAGVGPDARVVDVGCGATGLAAHLARAGWARVTGVDVSAAALRRAQDILGPAASLVEWRQADVLHLDGGPYDAWHDRAVFHFLTDPRDQARYADAVRRCTRPGSVVIVATFARDGPESCSGLPVARNDPEGIARALGLRLMEGAREDHVTPWGSTQRFAWALLRRE